jgi:uncharacterized membrane protein YbaN (DUF454 family)
MTPPDPPPLSKSYSLIRPFFFVLGMAFVVVGIVGYVLPIMPGTIFLIIAASCFARSSRRLEAWVENHPKFGSAVVNWRRHGAIPRKAKYLAISMMVISLVGMAITHPPAVWFWITTAILFACALFVATRPEGPKISG